MIKLWKSKAFLCHTLDWSSQAHLNSRKKWEIDSIAWWNCLFHCLFWKKHVGPEMMLCLFLENVHNNSYLSHTQNTLVPSHYDSRPGLLRDYEVPIILWNYIYIKIKSHQIWSIVLDVWKVKYLEESKYLNGACRNVPVCYKYSIYWSKWGLYE